MAKEIIERAVAATKELVPEHYRTLLGERRSGSIWGRPFTEEDFGLDWEELKVDFPGRQHSVELLGTEIPTGCFQEGCRYFFLRDAQKHFPDLDVRAVSLSSLFGPSFKEACRRIKPVAGAHGKELDMLVDGIDDETKKKMYKQFRSAKRVAFLIVGKEQDQDVVFTAHPGFPLAPCPKDFDGDFEALAPETAVKIL